MICLIPAVRRNEQYKRFIAWWKSLKPSIRIGLVVFWVLFKFTTTLIVFQLWYSQPASSFLEAETSALLGNASHLVFREINSNNDNNIEQLNIKSTALDAIDAENPPFKILHIVTTLAETTQRHKSKVMQVTDYDKLEPSQDRLKSILIPVLKHNIESLLEHTTFNNRRIEVDVYLILGFELIPERKQLITDALPPGVGLQVWSDAVPIHYDDSKREVVKEITRSLARQHRFVIKDYLEEYDFYNVWEDDMIVTGHHVSQFLEMSEQLEAMAAAAAAQVNISNSNNNNLTYQQLKRSIPGFFRVEVMNSSGRTQKNVLPIEPDTSVNVNTEYCCHLSPDTNIITAAYNTNPNPEDLMVWETGLQGFSLKQYPDPISWVALQTGPKVGPGNVKTEEHITGYWTGSENSFKEQQMKQPGGMDPQMFGQQGGFMSTRDQIQYFDEVACPGAFLPPFDEPFKDDGLYMANVEFWSGGFQLFGGSGRIQHGCNMQRILSLDPTKFSKQLLYHSSNNKQYSIKEDRRVRVNHMFQQLHTVLSRAKLLER